MNTTPVKCEGGCHISLFGSSLSKCDGEIVTRYELISK